MSSARKLACGGLALVICTSSVGCAGSRLRNLVAWSPTSDYKTLEEIQAADQEPHDAEPALEKSPLSTRLAALSPFSSAKENDKDRDNEKDKESDSAEKSLAANAPGQEGGGRLDRFLALATGRKSIQADPFLELDKATDPDSTSPSKVAQSDPQTEPNPEQGKPLAARMVSQTTRDASDGATASSETDRFFAELTGEPAARDTQAASAAGPGQVSRNSRKTVAVPVKQTAGLGETADSDAAVDDLESLLAESSSRADKEFEAIYREMRTRASEAGAIRSAEAAAGAAAGEVEDWSQEEQVVSEKLLARGTTDEVSTEFDRILARTSARTEKPKDQFEETFGAMLPTEPSSHSVAETSVEPEDVFGAVPPGKATPLVDDSAFEWKQSDRTQPKLPRISAAPKHSLIEPADEQRADRAGRTASPAGQASRTSAGTAQRAVALNDAETAFTSGFDGFETLSGAVHGDADPVDNSIEASAGTTQLVSHSVVRTEGLSADPFDSSSGVGEMAGGVSRTTTAAVATVASGRQGFKGLFTLRTLGLLLGGIIVAALLLVPKRSKSVQAE